MQTTTHRTANDRYAPGDEPRSGSKAGTSKALRMLEEGISEITGSESFRRYLTFTRFFHAYSARNQLLIYLQSPEATMVAGYNRWKDLGRQVKKGEKAIKILAPIVRKIAGEDEEAGGCVRRVVGFRDANVFALHQTEGKPLPAPPRTGTVEGGEPAADELYSLLSGICTSEGVGIHEQELEDGHYGYYNRRQKVIVLSTRLSPVEKATTLCHELCHHFLHPLRTPHTPHAPHAPASGAPREPDPGIRETEAEGASFVICDAFGIDTSSFTFPYVARHAKEPQTLAGVLDGIHGAVRRILDYTAEEKE